MAPTKEIVNLMKDMENNIKIHMEEASKKALKKQEKRFNKKIDEIFSNLEVQEKQMKDITSSQKFLNAEFEHLKHDRTNLTKLDLQKKLSPS